MKSIMKFICVLVIVLLMSQAKNSSADVITLEGWWQGAFLSTKGNITYVLNMYLSSKLKGTYSEATEEGGKFVSLGEGTVTGTITGKTFKFVLKETSPCKATLKGTFTVTKTVKGAVVLGKEMKGSYSGNPCGKPFTGKGTIKRTG